MNFNRDNPAANIAAGKLYIPSDLVSRRHPVESDKFIRDTEPVPVPQITTAKNGWHYGCIRDFIDCIKSGATPETVCTDNIKSLAMVFGAIASAETGKTVDLRSPEFGAD